MKRLILTKSYFDMTAQEKIKREMVQSFGDAYQAFGLSKLMGRVVALLIFSEKPLSLDEITQQLEMSKGPISQITRRLIDHHLIRKVWTPGTRKDYYEIEPEIFGNAFRNNLQLIKRNTEIAATLKEQVLATNEEKLNTLHKRLIEMETFYRLMEEHFRNFLDAWQTERAKLYQE